MQSFYYIHFMQQLETLQNNLHQGREALQKLFLSLGKYEQEYQVKLSGALKLEAASSHQLEIKKNSALVKICVRFKKM